MAIGSTRWSARSDIRRWLEECQMISSMVFSLGLWDPGYASFIAWVCGRACYTAAAVDQIVCHPYV